MKPTTSSGESSGAGPGAFVTTHWSVVLTAGRKDTASAQKALASLCETYWYPLYAFVRRRGCGPEDAQDLTQGFFAQLLAHGWVADADQARGRFRTFLLTALSRYLSNEWDRRQTQKRGGGVAVVSLDTEMAEGKYQAAGSDTVSPDRLYDRQWAMTLLERALSRVTAEHEQAGKSADFAVLRQFLTAERGEIPYADVAAKLSMSEAAARQAVHRVRKRFREVFREEIAQTLARTEEVEEEIRYLMGALAD